MKNLLSSVRHKVLFVFLLLSFSAFSQDFLKVDAVVAGYPKSFSNVEDLASQIKKDFSREDEMARAAFTWMAMNVVYDVKSYLSQAGVRRVAYSFRTPEEKLQKERAFENELIQKTLRSKKAVCQGYATLFQRVCELNGIEAVIVTGTPKTQLTDIGKLPENSIHAWNGVKVNGKWQLLDATWAAGSLDGQTKKFVKKFNAGYFFTDPDLFFLNHFPDNRMWLMTEKSEQDFAALPLYYRQYMEAGYTFVSPQKGVISTKENQVIKFRIENFNPKFLLTYAFGNEGQLTRVLPKFNNNIAEFEIPIDHKATGFLTLYVNNHSAVAYKIIR